MTTPTMNAAKLREGVAEEIRVLLARKRMSGRTLAQAIGQSQSYVSRRLSGSTAFDLDDLERIAAVLEVPVTTLLPARAAEVPDIERVTGRSVTQAKQGWRRGSRPTDNRPAGRARTGDHRPAGRTQSGGIRRPRLIGDLSDEIDTGTLVPSQRVA